MARLATQTPNISTLGADGAQILARSSPTAFAGRHALRDSRPLCCGVTTRCIIAPLPHRCIITPSYFEYVLQTCLPRMRRPAVSRESHHPRPIHGTACDLISTCWTPMLRVQMIIPRAREEGRLTILARASTRSNLHGQTTPITTTTAHARSAEQGPSSKVWKNLNKTTLSHSRQALGRIPRSDLQIF